MLSRDTGRGEEKDPGEYLFSRLGKINNNNNKLNSQASNFGMLSDAYDLSFWESVCQS